MSRFINRLPKVRNPINEAGKTTTTYADPDNRKNFSAKSVFSDKTRVAYNNFAHDDAYIPDKWGIAWGKYAKQLAEEVIEFVKANPGNAAIEQFLKKHKSDIFDKYEHKIVTGEAVENVVIEAAKMDYSNYLELCNLCIQHMYDHRNFYLKELDRLKFTKKKFASKPKVEALYTILKDSFIPEKKPEEQDPNVQNQTPANSENIPGNNQDEDPEMDDTDYNMMDRSGEDLDQNPDEIPEVDGDEMDDTSSNGGDNDNQQDVSSGDDSGSTNEQPPTEQQSTQQSTQPAQSQSDAEPEEDNGFIKNYKPRHMSKSKAKTYANAWEMIADFRENYDKKGEITNRIIHKMFEVVNKMKNDPDHIKKTNGAPVDSSEAATVAKQALQNAGEYNAARAVA